MRSAASFECLPVVEVFLEDGITDAEVLAALPDTSPAWPLSNGQCTMSNAAPCAL